MKSKANIINQTEIYKNDNNNNNSSSIDTVNRNDKNTSMTNELIPKMALNCDFWNESSSRKSSSKNKIFNT